MKTALEKFEVLKLAVRFKQASIKGGNFDGLTPEQTAYKAIYQTADEIIKNELKLSHEEEVKEDKRDEVRQVLEALKQAVINGDITPAEAETILESKEYREYAKIE